MHALIMAGGSGRRLARGEKPLTLVRGRPMISYITGAFRSAGCEPVVATSPGTPMTANWCRAQGITAVRTKGVGFVEDMVSAVLLLEDEKPLFVSVSDIPCINPGIISSVLCSYQDCGRDALSTWVPANRVQSSPGSMPYHERIGGVDACPAGVNILRGDRICEEQEEYAFILDEPGLALNVNTDDDLVRAEAFLNLNTTGRT